MGHGVELIGTVYGAEQVTGKRVRVSMLSGTAKTDAVPLNFFPGTVERRWDFAGTDMALGNVSGP